MPFRLQGKQSAESAVDIAHEGIRQVAGLGTQVGLIEGHQGSDVDHGVPRRARGCRGGSGNAVPGTMRLVPGDQECVSCANNARADLPARERIYLGPRWRVAHAFGTSLPGWLVLVPRRHTIALDDLTAGEAADLGPLLKAVSSALREVTGCCKTYVALFAEAEGFQHIHFHLIPRQPGLQADLRGPRVFGLLSGDPASYVPEPVMDEIAGRLSQALHREL